MFFPSKMKKLFAIIPKDNADSVSSNLLKLGVLDFSEIQHINGVESNSKSHKTENTYTELRKRVEYLLARSQKDYLAKPDLNVEDMHPINLDQADTYLDNLMIRFQTIKDRQRIKQETILQDEEMERHLLRFYGSGEGQYIKILKGSVDIAKTKRIEKYFANLSYIYLIQDDESNKNRNEILISTFCRDERNVEEVLTKIGWEDSLQRDSAESESESLLITLRKRLNLLKKDQAKALQDIEDLIDKEAQTLSNLWINARLNELSDSMQKSFGATSETLIFTGWVPLRVSKKVETLLSDICGDELYIEWSSSLKEFSSFDEKTPVELKNPKILRPFEALVKNYDLPEYGTIDPTPFVAVAYLLMFGLMFGDVGHGFVVFLIGFVSFLLFRKKDPSKINLLKLFMWCGAAGMVFGVLFGSYFGYQWFKPLWFDYHGVIVGHSVQGSYVSSIMDILGITIRFGIGVIGVGIILNLINCIVKKDWLGFIFGKQGVLGGIVYGSGLYTAFYFVGSGYKLLPSTNLLLFILVLPAALVGLAPLLEHLHHKKKHPGGTKNKFIGAELLMNGIVEILEVFTGYLSNTLSFMRVAGLGIAHVCLMIAFFQIADMFSHPIVSIIILILGNLLVILLEGLSAGIQSLRLNYYEFFSKYFRGNGRAYVPIRLSIPKKKEVS